MLHTGKPHAGGAVRACDLCKKIADDIVRALALDRALRLQAAKAA